MKVERDIIITFNNSYECCDNISWFSEPLQYLGNQISTKHIKHNPSCISKKCCLLEIHRFMKQAITYD